MTAIAGLGTSVLLSVGVCGTCVSASEPGFGLCSNNLPIDIFGLYREVIRHGGFVDNERYDDYNRWTGGINFGGKASSSFNVPWCLAFHALALLAPLRKLLILHVSCPLCLQAPLLFSSPASADGGSILNIKESAVM